ncbi:MAG: enoyl-CoA hydratase/isomerase family protein [Planctomycetota bacterium]
MIRVEHLPDPARGVAEIILDRPEKRNALTPEMLREIVRAADRCNDDDDVRTIVLRGEGRAFCAGFDLDLCRDDREVLPALLRELSGAVRALRRTRTPVVCAAHGGAIAGGCALLGGADIVVTDMRAKLGYPVTRLGISPAVTTPALCTSVTGSGARRLLLAPTLVDGQTAQRLGLAHLVVETPEDVIARAQIEAGKLARKPTGGLQATKAWMNQLDGTADDHPFDRALEVSLSLSGGEEERELLAQFWTT